MKVLNMSTKLTKFSNLIILCVIFCVILVTISTKESKIEYYSDLNGPIVKIPGLGILHGSITFGLWTNKTIYQFLGVKYAKSPSGSRRFKAPIPEEPWPGVRNVQNYGRACPQLGIVSAFDDPDLEDCLHLSVYTGNLHNSILKPVMIYIHGGGFYEGASQWYPPNYLMEEDVVLVVPQYRLDALGFLSTKSNEIPGNAAFSDVILALNWVQMYIQHFGGNASCVTLFGQSSGGVMVSALAFSPAVPSTLFQRIIVQSGTAMSSWAVPNSPVKNARSIAALAGLGNNLTLSELNAGLLKLDARALLNATSIHYNSGIFEGVATVGGRGITIGGPSNLFPSLPFNIKRSGKYRKDLDVMTGVTKHDGSFIVAMIYNQLLQIGKLNDREFITYNLIDMIATIFGDDGGGLAALANLAYWTHDEIQSGDFLKMVPGLIDLVSVITFKAPTLRLANAYAQYNPQRTYIYTFDYYGNHTRFGYGSDTSRYPFDGGVHHSNDYIYLFPYPPSVADLNAADTVMAKKMVHLWTSFAATGKPYVNNTFEWLPVTKYGGPYLHIDKEWKLGNSFLDEYNVSKEDHLVHSSSLTHI